MATKSKAQRALDRKKREAAAAKRRANYSRSQKVGAGAVNTQRKKRQMLKEAGNWGRAKPKKKK